MLGTAPAEPTAQARFLRALAIAGEGKLGPASEELELLARTAPALADRSAFEAGLLYERRAGLRQAARLFAAVSDRSHLYPEARLALARVARLNGDVGRAAAALAPLTSSPSASVRKRAWVERATLAQDAGARDEALGQLLLERTPWFAGAPALAVLSGDHDRLFRRNECRDVRRAARRAPSAEGCVGRLLAAEAAACAGADVSDELHHLAAACRQPEVGARAWMTLGVAEGRAGGRAAAVAAFREVARVAPTAPLAGEALFAAFWVEWRAAPAASDEDLVRLDALPLELSTQDRARVRYWRSRAAEARGDSSVAEALLAEVAFVFPATWYGRLARERLGARVLPDAVELAAVIPTLTDAPEDGAARERLAPGIAAVRLGLDDGAAELTALARRQPDRASNRLVVEVLNAAGDGDAAYRFARTVLRQQPGEAQDALVWQTAYPTHFAELIARNADAANLAPALVQGLVREESGFDPGARSHCGARGLMQLMPRTARALAFARGGRLGSLRVLSEPERNIQLGAGYLGQLVQRFDGNPAMAAAAYNGGPGRVARWVKSGPGPLDAWVEEIPLNETRNYVKDVLASADVYAHLLPLRGVLAAAGTPARLAQ